MRSAYRISTALSALVSSACLQHGALPEKVPIAVKVRSVERAAGAGSTRYSATIEPASHVDVAFKVGGYIDSIQKAKGVDGKLRLLQEGDHVSRGVELASVRKSDYLQRLAEAKAGLAEAIAAREKAQLDFDRAQKLVQSGSLAKAEHDAARIQLEASKARAEGAKVRVDEAETAVEDSTLRAPMEGIVLKRTIEIGTLVGPGAVAFAIADTNSVKAVFGVPDTILETLRLGAQQTITTEVFRGAEFSGRITRISPIADPKSRVFEVEVTVANSNPKQELKVGMIAALKLASADVEQPVAVLPLTAVVRAPGKQDLGRTGTQTRPDAYAVFVLDEQAMHVRVREVELGEFLGNLIPIKSGLKEGEKVVVLGAALCADGDLVQVIP
jgi:multidrug efflux system membrane fusion protein